MVSKCKKKKTKKRPQCMLSVSDLRKIMFLYKDMSAYKAKMARRAAPKMLPNATPVDEALLARSGAVGEAPEVPLPAENPEDGAATGTVAMVVAEAPELSETAVVSAGTAAGVPTTRTGTAAVAVEPAGAAAGVEKTTCGTVMTVEIAVVVEEDGITRPEETPVDSTHGTVMVVW
jgi:hypothetical protein